MSSLFGLLSRSLSSRSVFHVCSSITTRVRSRDNHAGKRHTGFSDRSTWLRKYKKDTRCCLPAVQSNLPSSLTHTLSPLFLSRHFPSRFADVVARALYHVRNVFVVFGATNARGRDWCVTSRETTTRLAAAQFIVAIQSSSSPSSSYSFPSSFLPNWHSRTCWCYGRPVHLRAWIH